MMGDIPSGSAPRLVIADPEMSGLAGHSFNYSYTLAEVAHRRGLDPVILATAGGAGFDGPGGIACQAVFTSRRQTRGASTLRRSLLGAASFLPPSVAAAVAAALYGARRRMRQATGEADADPFGRELAKALTAIGQPPLLLLHTITSAKLATLQAALPRDAIDRLLLILRHSPAEMDMFDPASIPVTTLLKRLAEHFGDRLHLFADTPGLAAMFAPLVPLPVEVVPIPVLAPPPRTARPAVPPRVLYAGVARAEKGFARLPELVAALSGRARFIIQSGALPAEADPLVRQAHRALRMTDNPDLELIEQSLSRDAYLALLASADLILLPYDGGAYGERSSGILAEALALGVPAVVPSGGWMESAAGSGRCVTFSRPEDLCAAVEQALAGLPVMTDAARAGAESWRRKHNPESLLDTLLGRPASRDENDWPPVDAIPTFCDATHPLVTSQPSARKL
jgi:glycosyltransferase involved in cell wall biosynthesis